MGWEGDMNKGLSTVFSVDVISGKIQEAGALASSQRLSAVVLVGCLLWSAQRSQPWVAPWVLLFLVLALFNLWRVTTGRGTQTFSMLYYVMGTWVVLVIARGTQGGELLLTLLLHPLSMSCAMHGLRKSLALAAGAGVVWWVDLSAWGLDPTTAWPVLGMLLVPLITAATAHPLAAFRQRVELAAALEAQLDPRRGLTALGLEVGERLRAATQARRVLICHRDAEVPTVMVCDADDGAFVASEGLGTRVLDALAHLPPAPQWLQAGRSSLGQDLAQRLRTPVHAPQGAAERDGLAKLALLLEADLLQAVPDRLGATGATSVNWMLVCYALDEGQRHRPWPIEPLAGFAADMRRLLQQASYIDRLQAEIAVYERSRIGRDMHDSAIQPYLGLKFAVEGLALRSDPRDALHGPIQELRAVCEAELVELRKTVSALRAGDTSGDFSLATALQRQCKRFERLFDIEVHLQVRPDMPASRDLISALLHMVNEALNNVRRHTQARKVWVALQEVPGALQLTVRDDAGQRLGTPAPAFEPRSLTERAQELGGTLQRRLHNGLDTEICITLPY